jgi:hypothetical protein
MSHPVPGHDYTEKHNEETNKEYKSRVKEGTKKKVASKMKTRSIHIIGQGHGVVKGPVGLKSYSDKK